MTPELALAPSYHLIAQLAQLAAPITRSGKIQSNMSLLHAWVRETDITQK